MKKNTVPASIWRNPIHFLAFGFGSGAAPVAPGTFGTIVGVLFYWPLMSLPIEAYIAVVAVITLIGVWLCHVTSRDLKVHDHPGIVWDEIAGYLITMIAAPAGYAWMLIGFVLFRLFDIWKPWPIKWIDRQVTGGWGIMLDDVLAGIFALVVLQVLAVYIVL